MTLPSDYMGKTRKKYIDLFAGIGGFRVAIENVTENMDNIESECVFSSEIKESAIETYEENFGEKPSGDIRDIDSEDIPDFDILFGGFPCQAFSAAGNRDGFADTRGTLFFEIERILEAKDPDAFVLENVPGLVTHDRQDRSNEMGRTMRTIIGKLEEMDYNVSWDVKNATDFGLPQSRKRTFIVGSKDANFSIDDVESEDTDPELSEVMEDDIDEEIDSKIAKILLDKYEIDELHGKSIKDTRGGEDNIHSWDLEVRGETNEFQREVCSRLLRQRRRKKWAKRKDIKWMDGMPLTEDEIMEFMQSDDMRMFSDDKYAEHLDNIREELQDLVEKNYLSYKYPKDLVTVESDNGGTKTVRKPDDTCDKGYDIKTGKLSFDISEILDPDNSTPTLVATDVDRLAVPDGNRLRRLTLREGLRLFGYPDDFKMPVEKDEGFDLLGNTVPVSVVESIMKRYFETCIESQGNED